MGVHWGISMGSVRVPGATHTSTSGRLHSEFIRLLFLQVHRVSRRIVSGSTLEMGTEHVMDVQITCYGCP
jgi:hypothetical protein